MSKTKSQIIIDGIMERIKDQTHIPVQQREIIEREIKASLTSFSMKIRYGREDFKDKSPVFAEHLKFNKENAAKQEILDGLVNCGFLSRSKSTSFYGDEDVVLELIAVK